MHNNQSNPLKTSIFTYSVRFTRLLMHILVGVIVSATVLPLCAKARKLGIIQWWSTRLIRIFNIQVTTTGEVPTAQSLTRGNMFIANHISWVDIHALMSVIYLRFIAKSEIRKWPVFGYLAASANVLFIERGKKQAVGRMLQTTVESLNTGDQLCLFPEGTTTDGTYMLPFKGSLIQSAINANAPIQPVAIFYPNPDNSANIDMAFIGEATMVDSIHTILKRQAPHITLHFFTPIIISDLTKAQQSRRALTNQVHDLIEQKLYKTKLYNQ